MEAIDQVKENLEIFVFMLNNIQVNKDILSNDDLYKYLYSVESVNKLVQDGASFREAYKTVGKQILDGDYHPDKAIKHTHEGSLGNLCNIEIKEKFIKFYRE